MKKKLRCGMPILIFVFAFLLFRYVLLIGFVPSESMEPTLKAGSVIIAPRLFDKIRVGDVVIFKHNGKLVVKRIAAIGGNLYTLNGIEYTVPTGKLIVLGDNSENSYDSRYWDDPYIDESDVIAKWIRK